MFPGIKKLDLLMQYTFVGDHVGMISGILSAMNSLKHLSEIRFSRIWNAMLSHIKYPQLEKLLADCTLELGGTAWKNFVVHHLNIQWLELNCVCQPSEDYIKS